MCTNATVPHKCWMRLWVLFTCITQVMCPFVSANAIACWCNKVCRVKLLASEQTKLLPLNGYYGDRTQWAKAIRWLTCCARENNINICHRDNGGEQKVGPYYSNGYYEEKEIVSCFMGVQNGFVVTLFKNHVKRQWLTSTRVRKIEKKAWEVWATT